ncbi:glycosyltransferase family 4 protein [Variovorax saccharolyticus]|uniref:glycosyltransferase family 4 protein n=1 Tax=Variovorax saccharolyticus TaxID=3053516 RepID=UPI002578FC66|nr:glycosyltransferase family 4 protein [Variovorax sp. J22R187]MDM0017556.1 glycosyltransferase family 4 protein [Variovorax sp. J22R187]
MVAAVNDIDLIKNSTYFDADFYRDRYPEIAQVDPYTHYIECGGSQGLWPSAFFDPLAYWAAYPDVRSARVNPLVHFLRIGLREQRWAGVIPVIHASACAYQPSKSDSEALEAIAASELFDASWYRKTYGDLRGLDPAEHYVSVGAALGWSPSPEFNGIAYSRVHKDIGTMNPLLHYLRYGRVEGRRLCISRSIKDVIQRELPALAQIEPDLMADNQLFEDLDTLTSVFSMPRGAAAACWRRLWAQVGPKVEHLVFVPWLIRGGADLAAVNVVRVLQQRVGVHSVALIVTDYSDMSAADWLPEGTRFVRLSDTNSALSAGDRKTLVEKLIWTLRPKSVFNVNSRACWEATVHAGRALARMTTLNALLFCRDYNADGRAVGYSDTHFRGAISHLHRVYFDTRYFIAELVTQYGLPPVLEAKLHYLPQPSPGLSTLQPTSATTGRPRILWAGRFSAQKNTELLVKIVKEGAEFDFDIWGSGQADIECQLHELAASRSNMHLCGTFSSLDELHPEQYTAFLFTSRYEGMPTIILSIAAAGLPIVATAVGGVSEMIDDQTGWPISDLDDPHPYLEALRQIAQDSALVDQKLEAMNRRMLTERSAMAFEKKLSD